jgi:hypothetical protein
MGRLVGMPYFSSQEAFMEQQQDAAEIRRARKVKAEDAVLTGETDAVRLLQVQISHRLQSQFEGRVIRRTPISQNPDGRPLIDLPPISIIYGVLKLTARELGLIDDVTEEDLKE